MENSWVLQSPESPEAFSQEQQVTKRARFRSDDDVGPGDTHETAASESMDDWAVPANPSAARPAASSFSPQEYKTGVNFVTSRSSLAFESPFGGDGTSLPKPLPRPPAGPFNLGSSRSPDSGGLGGRLPAVMFSSTVEEKSRDPDAPSRWSKARTRIAGAWPWFNLSHNNKVHPGDLSPMKSMLSHFTPSRFQKVCSVHIHSAPSANHVCEG